MNSWLVSSGFGLLIQSTLITDQGQFLFPIWSYFHSLHKTACLFHLEHMQISLFLAFIDLFVILNLLSRGKTTLTFQCPCTFLSSLLTVLGAVFLQIEVTDSVLLTPTKLLLFPSTCLLKAWDLCALLAFWLFVFHLLR